MTTPEDTEIDEFINIDKMKVEMEDPLAHLFKSSVANPSKIDPLLIKEFDPSVLLIKEEEKDVPPWRRANR